MDLFSGTTTASGLIASVTTSVASTFDSIYLIVALVIGVSFALYALAPWAIGIFKKVRGGK